MAHHAHRRVPEQELEERHRLPTLLEVLSRRTLAPVDLFSFYIYMRDQQRSVDYLDFWLDVSQHMSLCRHYVRELRRSMLIETPEMEKAGSKRSSQILGDYNNSTNNSPDRGGNQTEFFDENAINESKVSAIMRGDVTKNGHSPHGSLGSQARATAQAKSSPERPPRPSFMTTSDPRTDSNSPGHTVARDDIRASAEKILYTYLLPGSEREIVIPQHMLEQIRYNIEEEQRDDPEVFDNGKEYVFQAMERDAFPGFLQAKALGNLVPLSVLARLVIGLASMMGGFWAGFYMILTDTPKHIRCWVCPPLLPQNRELTEIYRSSSPSRWEPTSSHPINTSSTR